MVGFGEAMVRLSSQVGETLAQAQTVSMKIGGAELNGLIAAAAYGMPVTWVSSINDDVLGNQIVRHAESHGVKHALHHTTGARTGIYFVEMASYPRATQVFYDRSGSAASLLQPGTIDWGELLTAQSCFYSTGITAGTSSTSRATLEEALSHAVGVGATVAFDINYRSKLWPMDEGYAWVRKILPMINILSASDTDLQALGQPSDDLDVARETLGVDVLVVSSKQHHACSTAVTVRAIDDRGSSESSGEAFVIDRLGAGDAMFGAFLAVAPTSDLTSTVNHALEAALITYGIHGDAMSVSPTAALSQGRILR